MNPWNPPVYLVFNSTGQSSWQCARVCSISFPAHSTTPSPPPPPPMTRPSSLPISETKRHAALSERYFRPNSPVRRCNLVTLGWKPPARQRLARHLLSADGSLAPQHSAAPLSPADVSPTLRASCLRWKGAVVQPQPK